MRRTNNQNPQNNNQQCSVLRFDTSEWNQILYRRFNILSVDVELPSGAYNEGYRGEGYYHARVKPDFGNGVLATGKRSFYELLRLYSDIIANGGTVG